MTRAARLRGALGLALALGFLATPAAAWGGEIPQFRIDGSNGYEIVVGGRGSTALLSTVRRSQAPRSGWVSSIYIARGAASSTRIEAEFGSLGSVAVRFHPSGRVTRSKPARHCRGRKRSVVHYGVFVGNLRFRGEGGYTSAHIHRAKGKIVSRPSLSCSIATIISKYERSRGAAAKPPDGAKATSLQAFVRAGVSSTYFEAATNRAGKTHFAAVSAGTEGSLAFYRRAFVKASPLTFAFDNRLSFASMTPPAPFDGTASLGRGPDGSTSWTGSMTVSFPGEPDVPLAGPQFKTRFSRSW